MWTRGISTSVGKTGEQLTRVLFHSLGIFETGNLLGSLSATTSYLSGELAWRAARTRVTLLWTKVSAYWVRTAADIWTDGNGISALLSIPMFISVHHLRKTKKRGIAHKCLF